MTVCRHGIGLIANITVLGLCLATLLALAAYWFYVVRSSAAEGEWRGSACASDGLSLPVRSQQLLHHPQQQKQQ